VFALATLAAFVRESVDENRAAVLWGAVEAEERRAPLGAWERHRESFAARLRGLPSHGVQRGQTLTLDEAVAYALEGRDA